ncbi:MAG: TolC family protein [Candidatus Omnitrophota bacterium]
MVRKFTKLGTVFAAVAFLAGWTAVACAAETTEVSGAKGADSLTVRLDELAGFALQKNPEIIAAKARWLAAKKRIWADTSLPDPMMEIAPGHLENDYMVSQGIPFPAKLYEKGKMAQKEAEAAHFRYQVIERDVLLKLTRAYYDLYFTDASIEVIDEVKGLLKSFEASASARYSNLSGPQRDVAKAQAEVSMSLEKLYRLEQERESSAAVVNALLDRDPMTPVGKAAMPARPKLNYSLVELVNLAVAKRQEIKAAEAMAAQSGYAKRLAQLAYIPDLEIGFKYEDMKDAENIWMVPLRFNVPVWQNRVIPEIHEALQRERASRADLLSAKNETFREVKEAYHRYQAASKTADLYDTAVIPQAKLALSADKAGYESGKTDFLNLLDSERIYFNAKLSSIQYATEALKAYADLLRCCGLDFSQEG